MRADFVRLNLKQTVAAALAVIRESQPDETVIYFYVIDDENHLQGIVPTRRLLLSPLDKRIDEIMLREVVAVPQTATVLEACEFFILHRLLAFPVIDHERRLVGTVDVRLYTSELSDLDRGTPPDDLFQIVGVHLAEAQRASPWAAFRSRFPWLIANISGGILAAFLSGVFAAELQRVVAIAIFIPVVLALSESVSMQSLTLAIEVLHGREPTIAVILAKVRSETMIGLLLGTGSALLVAAVAVLWLGHWRITLVLLGGIVGGVLCSAVIGVTMPNVLRRLRRDPQVASGPVALAVSDIATLLIYFHLARWLL